MTTALFLLRCLEIGIRISDLKYLTIGGIIDIWSEKAKDGQTYDQVANQSDFDAF